MDSMEKILFVRTTLKALKGLWRKYAKQVESIRAVMREKGFTEEEIQNLINESRKR